MTDTGDTPGTRVERALGTVDNDWLTSVTDVADGSSSIAIAECAVALARGKVPAGRESRQDFH